MSMRDHDPWGRMVSLREAMNRRLEDSFWRSARDDERAEVAPTTDEASAESSRSQQTTDEASAERSHTQQTTATRQTGGAAGPSDETADLPGDASGAS
jgi:hypothetical protein